MIGTPPSQDQRDLFAPLLTDFIDLSHELVLLAQHIDWSYFEQEFAPLYSHTGKPAKPIRCMVGALLLKRLYNLGDETLAEAWKMNPYMQYFCGYAHFQHQFPCDPSDLVHFRKRLGSKGIEAIFAYSVKVHGKDARANTMVSDTTVQGNFTTFPTDAKLAKAVIDACNTIAQKEGISQRQSYKRVSKNWLRNAHNAKHPRRRAKARKAIKSLRTIAGRLVRELRRQLNPDQLRIYEPDLARYEQLISQQRNDKNKVYSLHKPFTACIAKGKAAHPYEFGNKVGMIMNPKSRVVVAIEAFEGNPHDSKTIAPLLQQMKEHTFRLPKELVYDRGGRGAKPFEGVQILTPSPPKKRDTNYQKRNKRAKFRSRAGIEPVFGHLKKWFRMQENYLKGPESPRMNAYLSAAGWNLKKLMEKLKGAFPFDFFRTLFRPFFLRLNWSF